MSIKWIGAILIITGCGGVGFSMAAAARQEERLLTGLIRVLHFMEAELQYRLTPLPELCAMAAKESGICLASVFRELAENLSRQNHPDAAQCMLSALKSHDDLPVRLKKHLRQLGRSLGRFDLPGQIKGIQTVRNTCESDLDHLRMNRDIRLRSYQTLSLCAGTALVIIFA